MRCKIGCLSQYVISMTDPAEALLSFQEALTNNVIKPRPCRWNKALSVFEDKPGDGNELRVTHAKIVEGVAQGIVLYAIVDSVESLPCFQIGYAVQSKLRGQGIGNILLSESMEEMKLELQGVGIKEYFLEAVVGIQNVPSNKLAARLLSTRPEHITCQSSGEPALQYLKKIT